MDYETLENIYKWGVVATNVVLIAALAMSIKYTYQFREIAKELKGKTQKLERDLLKLKL